MNTKETMADYEDTIIGLIRSKNLQSAVGEEPSDDAIRSYIDQMPNVEPQYENTTPAALKANERKIDNDFLQAYVAEIIYMMDKDFVDSLKENATYVSTLNVKEETKAAAFLGDALDSVGDKLYDLADFHEGYTFIVASPLIIAVLQSCSSSTFSPALEGTFKGPNNTMLVGQVDGTDVYSYIFGMDDPANGITDTVLVGNFNPETNEMKSGKLVITNLELA